MKYLVSNENKILKGELKVPASKSISNRLLIIQALAPQKFEIQNISDSEDTRVLIKALTDLSPVADIGHAGTSMRFLTAYFSSRRGDKVLTGSARMKERPIGNLVNALVHLGAEIEYTEKEGFPPLFIRGKQLQGGCVSIDSSVSSQFISALLLSAPTFKNGLELHLDNKVISSSYIEMTVKMMQHAGVEVMKKGNVLNVVSQEYKAKDITVEGDWSGVSYWYEMVALAKEAEVFIYSLGKNSVQGDSRCAEIFKVLGIHTDYFEQGIKITKNGIHPSRFDFDFIENPDLVQTLAVTCVMLGIPFCFRGTQSLRIKETDRIAALQKELGKFGVELEYTSNGVLEWNGKKGAIPAAPQVINTYHDHRMALAFAPVALIHNKIIIDDPKVVIKSYPTFWNELKNFGFEIREE